MVKLDPVGEGREEIGSIVGGWSGQLLGGTYVPGVLYRAKIEYNLPKTQSSWPGLVIKKGKTCLYV